MHLPRPLDDIRTAIVYRPVASPVALNFSTYLFGSGPEATRPDRMMRLPTAALLVQHRGGLLEHGDKNSPPIRLPRVALLGATSRGHVWATEPDTAFTLVYLAPGATRTLFGMDPRDLAEEMVSLEDDPIADSICRRIRQGPATWHEDLARRVDAGEAALAQRCRRLINWLCRHAEGSSVQAYADRLGLSVRSLQRMTRSAVGLTPKQVLAVTRVRRLVRLTNGGWDKSVADLAQAGGYFDQSHMRYELLRHRYGGASELLHGDHVVTDA